MTVSHLSEYLCRLHRLIGVGWSWKKLSHQSSSDVDDDGDGDDDHDDGDANNENEDIKLKIWNAILQKKICITNLNCPLCHLLKTPDQQQHLQFEEMKNCLKWCFKYLFEIDKYIHSSFFPDRENVIAE